MTRRGWLILTLFAVALLLISGRLLTLMVVDYQWYHAMGQEQLWWERITSQLLLQGGFALLGSLFAYVNFSAVRRTILAVAVPQRVADIELTTMIPAQRLNWITILLAVLTGIAIAAPFDDWSIMTMVRHGVPFGEIEGYHDMDLGFYVYWLPFEELLYLWALTAVVVMTGVVTILYALTRSLRMSGRRFVLSTHARRHISVLGTLVLLLLSWSYRLDSFELLSAGSGRDGLFLRVDHVVTLRVDVVLAVGAVAAAFVFFRAGWLGHTRSALITLSVMLVAALVLRHGLPSLLDRGSTIGDPARRDADYLATRALVTRRAYNVDAIKLASAAGGSTSPGMSIPYRELGRQAAMWDVFTARRIWPAAGGENPTASVDERVAHMLAPAFGSTAHGTIGMLEAQPGQGGQPWRLYERDLTLQSSRPIPVTSYGGGSGSVEQSNSWGGSGLRPLVAPGIDGYAVVADGSGLIPGARLDSFLSRLSHAWFARDASLLGAPEQGSVTEPPVFVPYRDVRVRVAALAPVLTQGSHILPLVHSDSLYWVLDLYSASSDYPLSQQWFIAGDIRSYFRHAGTAIMNSATGVLRIVSVAKPDPIAQTWMKLAPGLFVEPDSLPAGMLAMLPPPTDGAFAQLRSFARYGMRGEGEDVRQRHFPDSTLSPLWATPVLVDVAGVLTPALTIPILEDTDRFSGVATMVGGAERGTWWHPADRVGGADAVNATASGELAEATTTRTVGTGVGTGSGWQLSQQHLRRLLDSIRIAGPDSVLRGREMQVSYSRVHAIVGTAGPILVQSVHFSSVDGARSGTRTAMLTGERVETGRDLYDVASILSGMPLRPPEITEWSGSDVATRDAVVQRLYDRMREALRRADWVRFGAAFDSLGRLLGRSPE